MERGYQYGFSDSEAGVFDVVGRERKAKTMKAILSDYFKQPLGELALLDVGADPDIQNTKGDYIVVTFFIDVNKSLERTSYV